MWFIHQPEAIMPMIASPRIQWNARARLPQLKPVFRIMSLLGLAPMAALIAFRPDQGDLNRSKNVHAGLRQRNQRTVRAIKTTES